jgi:hypothetical protein
MKEAKRVQREETLKEWVAGVDRDGGADPKMWKFFDPIALPKITSASPQDTAGKHGYPRGMTTYEARRS